MAEVFIKKWNNAIENHNDRTIHALLLQFFTQILPLINASREIDSNNLEILKFVLQNLPTTIVSNYEKGIEIRHVLSEFFNEAFNETINQSKSLQEMESSIDNESELDLHSDFNENEDENEVESGNENVIEIEEDEEEENIDELLNLIDTMKSSTTEENKPTSLQDMDYITGIYTPISDSENNNRDNLNNTIEKSIDFNDDLITPQDSKGSEFFQKKNRELVENNLLAFFNLYQILAIPLQQDLTELLEYLIGLFPDAPGLMIKKILNALEMKKISGDIIYPLLSKSMDKDPASIIFALINYIQESMIEEKIDRNSIYMIAMFFHLFQEYVPIYPDYFMAHINLYIAVLGKYNELISGYAADILEEFTKHGDETIDELFFELYRKIPQLSQKLQSKIGHILHQALDLSAPFILERYLDGDRFNKKIMKEVYKNCGSSIIVYQEISLEIAIAIWNFNAQIQIQRSDEKSLILKPIFEILKLIQKQHIYSPYLLLQAVRDLDAILHETNPPQPANYLQTFITENHNITEEKGYFSALEDLIKKIKSFI